MRRLSISLISLLPHKIKNDRKEAKEQEKLEIPKHSHVVES
jgi:hypothetical protein